ncbi:uncharacterized protein LOC143047691 [Mytilus galloprovincialis]|uniref:NADH dehydrogenase (Ubiquinone) 1 beta subcomplex subunit 2 n=1 Tax=Mytilus galloprovincialis TaxID=29158 RepID=A0A8B6FUE6_MYTGA|nr:NADH dehydrogenase (ubiquinone) 1 beta subcomplex subunit 2 [Mytilus galloprovincialis]
MIVSRLIRPTQRLFGYATKRNGNQSRKASGEIIHDAKINDVDCLPGTSTFGYRGRKYLDRDWSMRSTEGLMMFGMWFWIFYKCITDYGHLMPHFKIPDPNQWTDEELGIPPDDVE